MLFVGNSRGGGRQLAAHLMKEENDHVEIFDLRGFAGDNLDEAFQEAYAISRGSDSQAKCNTGMLRSCDGQAL